MRKRRGCLPLRLIKEQGTIFRAALAEEGIVYMIDTRKRLETDLEELKKMIFLMGCMSANALEKSVLALKNRDVEAARQVIDSDDHIDELEEKIDNCCMEFAARYQPLGEDLRVVTSLMRIAVDLERIGDCGSNIAKVAIDMGDIKPIKPIKPLVDIPEMASKVNNMLDTVLTALDARSPELAISLFTLDDEIDDLEKTVVRDLFLLLVDRPELIEKAYQMMNVSRTLERAGDHVTNVAERVAYNVYGTQYKSLALSQKKRRLNKGGKGSNLLLFYFFNYSRREKVGAVSFSVLQREFRRIVPCGSAPGISVKQVFCVAAPRADRKSEIKNFQPCLSLGFTKQAARYEYDRSYCQSRYDGRRAGNAGFCKVEPEKRGAPGCHRAYRAGRVRASPVEAENGRTEEHRLKTAESKEVYPDKQSRRFQRR